MTNGRPLRCATAGAGELAATRELRLRAHQAEGRLLDVTGAELASPQDADATHLICLDGDRMVGYLRLVAIPAGPPDAHRRSAYAGYGLVFPRWLWGEGFVEGGAGAVDPEYQRSGVFTMLVADGVRRACADGFRNVVGAARDGLRSSYLGLGFTEIDRRRVTPLPGWTFDASLLHLDIDAALAGRLGGSQSRTMTVAARAGARTS